MKQRPWFKHCRINRLKKTMQWYVFWRTLKGNTVVLQLSTEALPSAVVTVVESHTSHCHGFHPNSDSNALILWNGCCGWRNGDSQPAVTAVSDASGEAMMLVWHSRVHSGAIVLSGGWRPHLLHKVDTDRGTMSLPTGDLSTQALYQIKQASMYTFTSPGHCASNKSVSCCLKIGQRGTQNGVIILIWQNRTRDSLRMVQKKLIRVLPPWPHW